MLWLFNRTTRYVNKPIMNLIAKKGLLKRIRISETY
jgi:hypothetical protein